MAANAQNKSSVHVHNLYDNKRRIRASLRRDAAMLYGKYYGIDDCSILWATNKIKKEIKKHGVKSAGCQE